MSHPFIVSIRMHDNHIRMNAEFPHHQEIADAIFKTLKEYEGSIPRGKYELFCLPEDMEDDPYESTPVDHLMHIFSPEWKERVQLETRRLERHLQGTINHYLRKSIKWEMKKAIRKIKKRTKKELGRIQGSFDFMDQVLLQHMTEKLDDKKNSDIGNGELDLNNTGVAAVAEYGFGRFAGNGPTNDLVKDMTDEFDED